MENKQLIENAINYIFNVAKVHYPNIQSHNYGLNKRDVQNLIKPLFSTGEQVTFSV